MRVGLVSAANGITRRASEVDEPPVEPGGEAGPRTGLKMHNVHNCIECVFDISGFGNRSYG